MITSVNHLSFTVRSLDNSVKFYKDILGLRLMDISMRDSKFSEKVTGIPKAELKIAYLSGNNCSIELIQYLSPKGKKLDTATCNIGSAHICFNVDGFMSLMNKLKKNKVKLAGRPQIIPKGPNRGRLVVYAKDNDSNNLEFISIEKYV
ncbi:MAG TPA: VOC family protein [Candidatus Nanoarchaeia archaeon]|nr:VOC family protein [Candidatus Nanoarchaeia archaeon]